MYIFTIALALYAISYMLVFEDGPYAVLLRFRRWVGVDYTEEGDRYGKTQVGDILNCPVCLSVWLSIPVVLIGLVDIRLLYPLAAVGVVIVLSSFIGGSE